MREIVEGGTPTRRLEDGRTEQVTQRLNPNRLSNVRIVADLGGGIRGVGR